MTELAAANPELMAMTHRFWISLALTAPLLFMAMAEMVVGAPVLHLLSGCFLT